MSSVSPSRRRWLAPTSRRWSYWGLSPQFGPKHIPICSTIFVKIQLNKMSEILVRWKTTGIYSNPSLLMIFRCFLRNNPTNEKYHWDPESFLASCFYPDLSSPLRHCWRKIRKKTNNFCCCFFFTIKPPMKLESLCKKHNKTAGTSESQSSRCRNHWSCRSQYLQSWWT